LLGDLPGDDFLELRLGKEYVAKKQTIAFKDIHKPYDLWNDDSHIVCFSFLIVNRWE